MNNFKDIYQIKDGEYRRSLRSKQDPTIISSDKRNKQLPFTKCHQLLGFESHNKTPPKDVYHRIQVLPQQPLQSGSTINRKNSQSTAVFKSYLTAVTQIDPKKSYSRNNLFERTRKISENSIQRSNQNLQPLKQSFQTAKKNYQIQTQDLSISRLSSSCLTLGQYKINKSMIKLQQTPLGYEGKNKFFLSSSKQKTLKIPSTAHSNSSDQVFLPKSFQRQSSQKQPLKYKRKLITLIQLKNSQSSDDLNTSIHSHLDPNEDNTYFNFGKITQSKIIGGDSQARRSHLKLEKLERLTDFISSSVIQDAKEEMENNQSSQKIASSKNINNQNGFGQQFQPFQDRSIEQSQSSPKKIVGIKKCNKPKLNIRQTMQQDSSKKKIPSQQSQKRIQTPKFGKIFSFKDENTIKQKQKNIIYSTKNQSKHVRIPSLRDRIRQDSTILSHNQKKSIIEANGTQYNTCQKSRTYHPIQYVPYTQNPDTIRRSVPDKLFQQYVEHKLDPSYIESKAVSNRQLLNKSTNNNQISQKTNPVDHPMKIQAMEQAIKKCQQQQQQDRVYISFLMMLLIKQLNTKRSDTKL